MIHVIAQVELKEGQLEAFLREFRQLVPQVLAEQGCIEYGPTVDAETELERQHTDPQMVTIIERWQSVEHLNAHLIAPHMHSYRERVKDMVIGVRLNILRPA
ncbi:MAG: putative quinol monooxygenase [Rubripirellula sp.]